MSLPNFTCADMELYTSVPEAITALRTEAKDFTLAMPPLPPWALPPEVEEFDGVTLIRPKNEVVQDWDQRPGLRYRDLVNLLGRTRVVFDFTGIKLFGHPFHDDILSILRELGKCGGRMAICHAGPWYIERMNWPCYRQAFQVVDRTTPSASP